MSALEPDDELDALLRGAMKTLDDSVPSGYFEALPNRIQERIEMQTTSSTGGHDTGNASLMNMTTKTDDSEPKAESSSGSVKREEDSGLHDIRSLAKSTRMRVSQSNIAAVRPGTNNDNDDLLASASSSGWKSAVALPEPARMISLPEISELPSKAEIKKAAKAEKAAEKIAAAGSAPAIAAAVATPAAESAPALAAVTPIGAGRARAMVAAAPVKAGNNNTKIVIAAAGLGVAAAAGIAFFVMARGGKGGGDAAMAAMVKDNVVAMTVTPAPDPAPAAQAPVAPPVAAAVTPPPAADDAKSEAAMASPELATTTGTAKAPAKTAVVRGAAGSGSATKQVEDKSVVGGKDKDKDKKDEQKKVDKGAKDGAKPGEGEPSFDKLLDEAGVDKNAKPKTVALDKKQLTGDDFKQGMAGVTGAAMACYAGTQGTATIKLVIAPNGKVTKATVSGVFAGKAEATCVANAVRGASFPAWDGGPQTFGYSYLLQEK